MRTRGIYPAGRMLSLCLALILLTVPVSAALSGCHGRQERALIAGISEEKKETQYFLERLWCGAAMPAELNALYDDYIGEKEWQDDRGIYAAC